jgi:hypothetical protein
MKHIRYLFAISKESYQSMACKLSISIKDICGLEDLQILRKGCISTNQLTVLFESCRAALRIIREQRDIQVRTHMTKRDMK